jgi:diadenosine tetraphosphatase ApaH/serine/threonine PP2A family protein phosphatase
MPSSALVLGLLYDVHGNLPALEAVLGDARAMGVAGYVLGGDYALFGGWPEETVARLRELAGATWIRGNGERWTAAPGDAPGDATIQGAIAACAAALGGDLVARLAALPERARIGDTLVVHGSPLSDVRSFLPQPGDDEDELLAGEHPPRLVFGHTHLPFARRHGDIELINPGSVGMPFDGDPRAAYAVLHPDGSVQHRRVAYDHAASAARVRGTAWGDVVARRIEQAAFV